MNPGEATALKSLRRLVGIVFLVVFALLIWLSVAIYNKRFVDVSMVTLHTSSVGHEMHEQADVKWRGVVVGKVRDISADGTGATLDLAMHPDVMHRLPANVTAQLLPTTLFGQRYVALIEPERPGTETLADDPVISQDRSKDAIELQQVLKNVLPVLTAVQPQKLSATLTALARALQGRGDDLGRNLKRLNAYLKELNPKLPEMNADIAELVKVADAYNAAAPDILQALTDFTVTSRTIVNQRINLSTLYGSVTNGARDITTFLRRNKHNIIKLAADSRPSVELLAKYAPEFPCTLRMLADFVPAMNKALGKGTDEHGLHVTVTVVPSKGKYVPGRDTPHYTAHGGPHCYSVPYDGTPTGEARSASPKKAPAVAPGVRGGLGPANSSRENELVNELVGSATGVPPSSLPDWTSVLVGPVYRGTEVKLK